jgi:hypothetical protein
MTTHARKRLGDRRSKPRFEFVGQLWGALDTTEPLRLLNLGRTGALLDARFAMEVDTVHRLRIASNSRTSDLQARVRHITESPDGNSPRYLIGLEFIALPAAAMEHIDELMAANPSPVGETRLLGTEE